MDWCPRCDQGWVVRCRVRERADLIKVCEECDTVWLEGQPVSMAAYTDLDPYLSGFGKEPLWSNLVPLERGAQG